MIQMLRRMLHRELSPEELEKARQGSTNEYGNAEYRKVVTYSMVEDEPQLRIAHSSLRTTRDVSHPEITHTGFYNDKVIYYRYNPEGQLVDKHCRLHRDLLYEVF